MSREVENTSSNSVQRALLETGVDENKPASDQPQHENIRTTQSSILNDKGNRALRGQRSNSSTVSKRQQSRRRHSTSGVPRENLSNYFYSGASEVGIPKPTGKLANAIPTPIKNPRAAVAGEPERLSARKKAIDRVRASKVKNEKERKEKMTESLAKYNERFAKRDTRLAAFRQRKPLSARKTTNIKAVEKEAVSSASKDHLDEDEAEEVRNLLDYILSAPSEVEEGPLHNFLQHVLQGGQEVAKDLWGTDKQDQDHQIASIQSVLSSSPERKGEPLSEVVHPWDQASTEASQDALLAVAASCDGLSQATDSESESESEVDKSVDTINGLPSAAKKKTSINLHENLATHDEKGDEKEARGGGGGGEEEEDERGGKGGEGGTGKESKYAELAENPCAPAFTIDESGEINLEHRDIMNEPEILSCSEILLEVPATKILDNKTTLKELKASSDIEVSHDVPSGRQLPRTPTAAVNSSTKDFTISTEQKSLLCHKIPEPEPEPEPELSAETEHTDLKKAEESTADEPASSQTPLSGALASSGISTDSVKIGNADINTEGKIDVEQSTASHTPLSQELAAEGGEIQGEYIPEYMPIPTPPPMSSGAKTWRLAASPPLAYGTFKGPSEMKENSKNLEISSIGRQLPRTPERNLTTEPKIHDSERAVENANKDPSCETNLNDCLRAEKQVECFDSNAEIGYTGEAEIPTVRKQLPRTPENTVPDELMDASYTNNTNSLSERSLFDHLQVEGKSELDSEIYAETETIDINNSSLREGDVPPPPILSPPPAIGNVSTPKMAAFDQNLFRRYAAHLPSPQVHKREGSRSFLKHIVELGSTSIMMLCTLLMLTIFALWYLSFFGEPSSTKSFLQEAATSVLKKWQNYRFMEPEREDGLCWAESEDGFRSYPCVH